MLRHEALTLLVLLGTMVATLWLYIIIPKGFLPQQDTGLIFAVMEGGDEVSFAEMQRLRADGRGGDPQGSRGGRASCRWSASRRSTPRRTPRGFAITLRPRDVRRTSVTTVIERLQQRGRCAFPA